MTRTATRTSVSSDDLGQIVAARIRQAQAEARNGSGIQNEDLARDLDVSLRLVQKWRAGTTTPSHKSLVKLAQYFDRDVSWFFTADGAAA